MYLEFMREFDLFGWKHHVWRGLPGSGKTDQMLEVQSFLTAPSEVISLERIHDDLGLAYGEDDALVESVQSERIAAANAAHRMILCDDWNLSSATYSRLARRIGPHAVHDLRKVPMKQCIENAPGRETLIRLLASVHSL